MAADLTNTNELVVKTASMDTATSTSSSIVRTAEVTTVSTETLNALVVDPGAVNNQIIVTAQNSLSGTTTTTPSANLSTTTNVGKTQPINYKFNLPPHNWSLPVRPVEVDEYVVGKDNRTSFHGLRRGRLWYWAGANDTTADSNTSSSGNTSSSSTTLNLIDTSWGFQFLWNPTTISTNVSRNMDITPSSADTLRVVAGVFPGQETVNLSIVLDRTNDFACIKAATYPAASVGTTYNLNEFTRYYSTAYPGASIAQNMNQQINNLMNQGTMADLEYLFKAINGSGNGNLQWTNLLGKNTANVGYLAPTLLGIQLGPTLDSLSYVGWASNISLNHTAFTETMIPIRTEVNIAIQCFAGSGLTSGV